MQALTEIPGDVDTVTAIITTDGELTHVLAQAGGIQYECGWRDPDLAVHKGDVHRLLLDLGFAQSGQWEASRNRDGMCECRFTRFRRPGAFLSACGD
jgi:hypothetical protein